MVILDPRYYGLLLAHISIPDLIIDGKILLICHIRCDQKRGSRQYLNNYIISVLELGIMWCLDREKLVIDIRKIEERTINLYIKLIITTDGVNCGECN